MRLLREMVHNNVDKIEGNIYRRKAARGIVLDGENILLLYTRRYNDYSIPGGGIDPHEDYITGLKRELNEETGATNIKVIDEYGIFEEYRRSHYKGYDIIHMTSYFYLCDIDKKLGKANLEDYEVSNGMSAVWMNIYDAIEHNKRLIETKDKKMGLSVERETFVLELIAKELVEKTA
jgi:ADP-ribose pyrophosphatase YjhB (NUDIX family)